MQASPTSLSAPATKPAQVTEALGGEIRAGRLRVGARLPSEAQLSQRRSVSRQTVRAALRTPQQEGLVGSPRGVGSIVLDTQLETRYRQSFSSALKVLRYATTAPFKLVQREEILVDVALAARVGCTPATTGGARARCA